ncbi:DUF433 domain-containing protein [Streptomyces zingiberis]|uniref:DUF433 domain-containing protein n=1 Tax=Streptomyces zingiberis TaxID=2053010 RepID=A0ABX1BYV5_9ACTN|nr:DUF433 domain-containing protein [Streptomyces zingiberis]NJQ02879.1 DUF433 domain-containing protein [Streptomyces zingiberis]
MTDVDALINVFLGEDTRFSVPLYSQEAAARYLRTPAPTFRKWARGYRNRHANRPDVVGDPLITSLGDPRRGASVPFIGLAEGMFLSALRAANVPMQKIRPALDLVRTELGVEHALASKRLYTDGADLLYEVSDHLDGDERREPRKIIVLRDGQYVFREVVERYMKQINYDSDGIAGYANRLLLPGWEVAAIAVKPGINYGQPFFVGNGTPLAVVEDALREGVPSGEVAAEHDLPDDVVAEVDDCLRLAT